MDWRNMLDGPWRLNCWPEFTRLVSYGHGRAGPPICSILAIPSWLPLLVLAPPTAWLWSRDRRQVGPGCCAACGYDLTGNVTGQCSECGTAVEPVA